MILFYKRLREKLLQSGQTKRYLLYAMGEIILVMIGILLALQVNNWNEERKERDRESQALIRLYFESENIIADIKEDIEIMGSFIEHSKIAAEALRTGDMSHTDKKTIIRGIEGVSFYPGLSTPRSVYDELSASGQLREIRSKLVTEAISDYYSSLSYFESQLSYFRNVAISRDRSITEGYYTDFNRESDFMKDYEVDFEKLSANREFRTWFSRGLRNSIVFQFNRKNLLKTAVDMCQILARHTGQTCSETGGL